MAATATSTSAPVTLTGCVKWFNNSLNYGFITVLSEGEHHNADIFVHQSNIKTKRDCFRTLYTGECVQFELTKSDNEKHPVHAVNVTGFNGGSLHCENPSYRGRPGSRGGFRGASRGGHFQRAHRGVTRETPAAATDATGSAATAETTQATAATDSTTATSAPTAGSDQQTASTATTTTKSRRGRGRGTPSA